MIRWMQIETTKVIWPEECEAFRLFWNRLSERDRQAILDDGCIQISNDYGEFSFYPVARSFNILFRPATLHGTFIPPYAYELCIAPSNMEWLADYEILLLQLFYIQNLPETVLRLANPVLAGSVNNFHERRSNLSRERTQTLLTAINPVGDL